MMMSWHGDERDSNLYSASSIYCIFQLSFNGFNLLVDLKPAISGSIVRHNHGIFSFGKMKFYTRRGEEKRRRMKTWRSLIHLFMRRRENAFAR